MDKEQEQTRLCHALVIASGELPKIVGRLHSMFYMYNEMEDNIRKLYIEQAMKSVLAVHAAVLAADEIIHHEHDVGASA